MYLPTYYNLEGSDVIKSNTNVKLTIVGCILDK